VKTQLLPEKKRKNKFGLAVVRVKIIITGIFNASKKLIALSSP